MPNQFSLDLVPRYGPADYAADQAPALAIGHAIETYLAQRDAQRQERNTIAQEGGYPVGAPPETTGQRLGRYGSAIKSGFNRIFRPGTYQAERSAEADKIAAPDAMSHFPVQVTPRRGNTAGNAPTGGFLPSSGPAHPGHTPFDENPADFGLGGGYGGGVGSAIDRQIMGGGLNPTYDIEASTGQHYRIPRQPSPQILAEIIRAGGENERARLGRESAERIAGTRAGATTEAARIRAQRASEPRPESPSLTRSHNAAAARNEAELGNISRRQLADQADQLVQSLQAQNPGRPVTPQDLAQYAGGLYRNGRLRQQIPTEELYAALDRYHNPPNRSPTPTSVMGREMERQLGQGARPIAPPVSTTTPRQPNDPGGNINLGAPPAGRGGGRTSQVPAAARYDQLKAQGLGRDQILARMRAEGYPPPQ